MIRFVHTADLQIGKPFNWADPDALDLHYRRLGRK
jgi:DNA repair exonuclease SbcCD nuclease subunit